MTLYSNISSLRPSFIGFDHVLDQMQKASQHSPQGYPPHNIIRDGEDKFAIELAVAGYTLDDLDIEHNKTVLTISGDGRPRGDSEEEQDYVHRGISQKKFSRSFNLADHVQVMGATLVNGILRVELERIVPEELKPRKIAISQKPELLLED
jgi:molecular chaperone IbpA